MAENNSGLGALARHAEVMRAVDAFREEANQIQPLNGPDEWDRDILRDALSALLPLAAVVLDREEQAGEVVIVHQHVVTAAVGGAITHLNELALGRSDHRLRPAAGGASRTHSANVHDYKRSILVMVDLIARREQQAGHRDYKARARRDVAEVLAGALVDGKPVDAKRIESWEKRRKDPR
jgi:hypothetical protein